MNIILEKITLEGMNELDRNFQRDRKGIVDDDFSGLVNRHYHTCVNFTKRAHRHGERNNP